MSSGFVSGGTVDAPNERSDEWLAAQREIEANRQRKLDEQAQQSTGKSLFETLEANKAAKQDAFEEANRIKNQFRALDEDEVEYLDSVLESTRREEARVKRETAEGLALFRQQQEEADKKARAESSVAEKEDVVVEEENWAAGGGKKRKRAKDKEGLKGVKIRRLSTTDEKAEIAESASPTPAKVEAKSAQPPKKSPIVTKEAKRFGSTKPNHPAPTKSSLVAYGSDSDDE